MNKCLKNSILYGLLLLSLVPKAQVNANSQWIWIKGDSTVNYKGVYGIRGMAANANIPCGRYNSVDWEDTSNNLWLFGGLPNNSNSADYSNDLWKFNPSLNAWTWIKGDTAGSNYGIYGIPGMSADDNKPGGRSESYTWSDDSGNLWLFGGIGYATNGSPGHLNDLWKYNMLTNQWTWINGDNTISNNGIYGTQGIGATSNKPGARGKGMSWRDKSGNLWLFGGAGTTGGPFNHFNDLWRYDLTLKQWTWVNGDNTSGSNGVYGTKGIPSVNNKPGARAASAGWTDNSGNFWLFGGNGYAETGNLTELNDLWEYDPLTNQWTWISGDKVGGLDGVYGTRDLQAVTNKPGARVGGSGCVDDSGNFFLFGGIGHANNDEGSLNDLWKYNPADNEWTWIKGDSTAGNNGIYGVQGTAAISNKPGARFENICWADSSGSIYLFGGNGYPGSGIPGYLNDLWKISSANIILPLTLLNFSASPVQREVLVSWQTTKETNSAYFNIEHSPDGRNFTVLGLETAVDNNSFTKSYSFTDHQPWAASNFYRLKIVDKDGKFSYSKIVEVNMYLKKNFQIFPNPAKDIIYVLANGTNENATIQVFDVQGRKVIEEKITLKSNIPFSLNIKNLLPGTYSLILKKQYTTEQQKFVKE